MKLNGGTPIYRLYNTQNGAYLYTHGETDRDNFLKTYPAFEYTDGIPAFYASLDPQDGLTPIYRQYNTQNGDYLYTHGETDRDNVLRTYPTFKFTDRIPAFYAKVH
jgi:hypothetical protein